MTTRPGYVWDAVASEWVEIGQSAVVAPVSYQSSAPSSPATGDIWIDSDDEVPGITSSLNYRWRKIATGGETSLSGNDSSGLTLVYNPGYEQLYLNGVLQYRGSDYTATSGSTISGLTALTANDTVEILSFVTAPIGDTYTQAAANSLFSTGLRSSQLLHVRDEKAQNTAGGTFTSGAWQTRVLNTVKTNTISGASVASNQMTLPAGTYWVEASAPAWIVTTHQAKLYNITDSSDILVGYSVNGANNGAVANADLTRSDVKGLFTISGTKAIELQHRCNTTQATNGYGTAANFGTEVYSDVIIWKVA
jgi:hypothetical protein